MPKDGQTIQAVAVGDLTLHGVTRSVEVSIQAQRNGDEIEAIGSVDVALTDYAIEAPTGFLVLSIAPTGTIELAPALPAELSRTRWSNARSVLSRLPRFGCCTCDREYGMKEVASMGQPYGPWQGPARSSTTGLVGIVHLLPFVMFLVLIGVVVWAVLHMTSRPVALSAGVGPVLLRPVTPPWRNCASGTLAASSSARTSRSGCATSEARTSAAGVARRCRRCLPTTPHPRADEEMG